MSLSIILIDQYGVLSERLINKILVCIQKDFEIKEVREIELHIIDDIKMKEINYRYRGINDTTDVLSFSFAEQKDHLNDKFILPNKTKNKLLGQIFVSHDQIRKQAKLAGIDAEIQAIRLFVHGLLHLLGFDHQNDSQESKMKKYEKKIINNILCR